MIEEQMLNYAVTAYVILAVALVVYGLYAIWVDRK